MKHLLFLSALGLLATLAVGLAAQEGATATWQPAAYLKVAHPDEDDALAAGDALTGVALAMSRDGSTLATSARGEDGGSRGVNGDGADNTRGDSGAAYVFARSGGTWAQQAYLKASNAEASDHFGFAVALSGDGTTLAVSANFEDSAATGVNGDQADNAAEGAGAVYVFVRAGGNWTQQAYLKASNTEADDRFGYALALSDDGHTLAVGAIGEDSAATGINGNQADNAANLAGAAYVFTRTGAAWSQQAYVKASNTGAGDLFGFCVALDGAGATLAVCGYDEDSSAVGVGGNQNNELANGSGAAYVFARTGTTWTQQAYVKQSNTTLQSAFGSSIILSHDGRTLAVGAVDEDAITTGVDAVPWQADRRPEDRTRIAENSAGALYVYVRAGTTWMFQAYLKSSTMRHNDQFGIRMAFSDDGNVLAASSPLQPGGGRGVEPGTAPADESSPESGAVYVFTRRGTQWAQQAHIKAPNAQEYDMFGTGVALSGDGTVLAVGAAGEDGNGRGAGADPADNSLRDAGALYIYTR